MVRTCLDTRSVFVFLATPLLAQQTDPPGSQLSAPVVVTASRRAEDPFLSPYQVEVVGRERLLRRQFRTVPQALREIPGVLVQETSAGQGSPFLRGFTGFQNLFLIDGVRLNNSIFRSGPNQYWNTVDVLSLDRLEVLKGPAGAQWGSDAIGGVVQAFSRSPYVHADQGLAYGGSSYLRYATAEDSLWGRAEMSLSQSWEDGTSTGFLLGADAKHFGDIEGGRGTGTQYNTGYDEGAVDFKVEHWLDGDSRLVFLHQQVAQRDVPRTHSTQDGISFYGTSVGSDLRRDLDQNRRLTYLQYHATNLDSVFDSMRWSVSWHEQEELQDRIRSSGLQTLTGARVHTLGAFAQFESQTSYGNWLFGAEIYHDEVDSTSSSNPIQGSVGDDSSYDLLGVFMQDVVPIGDDVELTAGVRYTYAALDADSVQDPVTSNQIGVEDSWDRITGNLRMRWDLAESWNVFTGASQGFRAPNLSDMTSFGVARSGESELPALNLTPEQYISYEVGTKYRTADAACSASWFYTEIEDQILRYPTATTNASGEPEVTKANIGDGHIEGVEFQGSYRLLGNWAVFGAFTWQYGRVRNFDAGGATATTEYTSRLMPVTTLVGARWEPTDSDFYAESTLLRAEDADKLSAGDQRDTQRIPPGGTPSYTVWNMSAGWRVSETATLDVSLDNITDVDYRVHGSGSNMPGRSLIVGMRVRF